MRPLSRIASYTMFVATALIASGCDETAPRGPGSISVVATVSGHRDEPLVFPFGISIDGGTPREHVAPDTISLLENGLAHGTHVVQIVELSGFDIPAACGTLPRKEIQLLGDDTADVVLDVQCARTTGDLLVSAITTGSDIDADGYLVLVDQQPRALVGANTSTMIRFLPPGSHTVTLLDVATNCTAPATQSFSLAAGAQVQALFRLTCAPIGVLRFVTSMAGADRDPDGFVIQVDNGPPVRPDSSGRVNVRVAAGTRSFSITDVQPNCTLAGPSTGTQTVAQGDTVVINVSATCTPISLGSVGVAETEPAGDTLANPNGIAPAALDVLGVTGRYSPGFLIVVVRFNRAVASAIELATGSVFGYMQFDVDENVSTGIAPASNAFGGNAQMGAEYLVDFFGTDTASTILVQTTPQTGVFGVVGRVRVAFQADSMLVFVPLNKLADDQNMAMTFVIGTLDHPTDVAPNIGTFLLRPPASVIAGAAVRLKPQPVVRGRPIRIEEIAKWRRLTP